MKLSNFTEFRYANARGQTNRMQTPLTHAIKGALIKFAQHAWMPAMNWLGEPTANPGLPSDLGAAAYKGSEFRKQ